MSELFTIVGNLLIIAVLTTYFKQVVTGDSTPNPTTWLLWVVVGLMNTFSYFMVVEGDLWQSLVTIVTTSCVTILFLYTVVKGKFGKFGSTECICLILAVGVGILWKMTKNADIANISLQVVYFISFYPTIKGLLQGTLREKPLPWNLAVAAYFFIIMSILTADSYRWQAFIFPVVNGVLGNGSVALIIKLKKGDGALL